MAENEAILTAAPEQESAAAPVAPGSALLDIDSDEVGVLADPFPSEERRPQWCVYDDWVTRPSGQKCRPGVYFHGMTSPKGEGLPAPYDDWICGPLHIEAYTASLDDGDHGRLLRWRNVSSHWKQWAMPMELLAGDGREILSALLRDGLEINRQKRARLLDYINAAHTKERMQAAATTGWHGMAFVLPDEVIGSTSARVKVVVASVTQPAAEYEERGTPC